MIYKSTRHEETNSFNLNLPWDKNTAKGWGTSIALFCLFLFISSFFSVDVATPRSLQVNTVPLEILNFGLGDGTGMSKGNLTEEGAKHKGEKPSSNLEDSRLKSDAAKDKSRKQSDYEFASNYTPVDKLASEDNSAAAKGGTDSRNIGDPVGDPLGQGLGSDSFGRGEGYGFGDIEWGGGGNRIVVSKHLPKFPRGVNTAAQIKLRFEVMPDGTVRKIIPLQKADPELEAAAINALKKWRFNKLESDVVMVGIIPMTFMLR